jgi:nucleoid-associated protein YgaU
MRRLSPAFMQRLVLAALSVQLVAGPAANADAAVPGPEWAPTQQHLSTAPADSGNSADQAVALPPLDGEAKDNSSRPSTIEPGWQPAAPVVGPGLLTAPAVRSVFDSGTEAAAVTVLAGDTLWEIAAFAMGPEATDVEIAMEWPRWYEANRAIIGQDPNVLLPGQILQPPAAA